MSKASREVWPRDHGGLSEEGALGVDGVRIVRGLPVGDYTCRAECDMLNSGRVPGMGVSWRGVERLTPSRCGTKQASSRATI